MSEEHTGSTCTYSRDGQSCVQVESKRAEEKRVIRGDHIVGVLPLARERERYSLFYTEEDTAEATATAIPRLGRLDLQQVPPALLEDFGVTGEDTRRFSTAPVDVVVSTQSGTCQASRCWEKLLEPLLVHLGVHYEVHFTVSAQTVTELAEARFLPRAQAGEPQKIILLSGDGGLVDLLNGFLDASVDYRSDKYRKPQVSLLPLGTGNALANSCGITSDETWGLSTLLRGKSCTLPYFTVAFSAAGHVDQIANNSLEKFPLKVLHGAVVCSWGLHASLVADSDSPEYRKHGVERFKMAAQENLFPADGSPPHTYRGKLSTMSAGQLAYEAVQRDSHAYVLVTLVSQLDKGFLISPDSRPLDPHLRIIHFDMPEAQGPEKQSGHKVMEMMMGAYQGGKHLPNPLIGYGQVDGVRISFKEDEDRWRRVCIDGKIVVVERGGWLEIRLAEDFTKPDAGPLDLLIVRPPA